MLPPGHLNASCAPPCDTGEQKQASTLRCICTVRITHTAHMGCEHSEAEERQCDARTYAQACLHTCLLEADFYGFLHLCQLQACCHTFFRMLLCACSSALHKRLPLVLIYQACTWNATQVLTCLLEDDFYVYGFWALCQLQHVATPFLLCACTSACTYHTAAWVDLPSLGFECHAGVAIGSFQWAGNAFLGSSPQCVDNVRRTGSTQQTIRSIMVAHTTFEFCRGAVGCTGDKSNSTHKTEANQYLVVVNVNTVNKPPLAQLAVVTSKEAALFLSSQVQQVDCSDAFALEETIRSIHVSHRSLSHLLPHTDELSSLPTADRHATTDGVPNAGQPEALDEVCALPMWPHNCVWHRVVISSTGRPTKKANKSRMPSDAQMTMVCAMIRAVKHTTHKRLAKSTTRPPGDPNLYLLYDLAMSERGPQSGNAHFQNITVLMSAYPIAPIDPMELVLARRAVGLTQRDCERTIRDQQEKDTLNVWKTYLKALPFDKMCASMNWMVKTMDLENEVRHCVYSGKDYGEDWAVAASFVVDEDGNERTLTHNELMQVSSEAHTYASSERRAYKKVLKQKHLYLTDDNATMRIAAHFERNGVTQMMPALETGIKNMVLEQSAKIDFKGLPRLHNSMVTDSIRRNLLLIVDTDPTVLKNDPHIISEVWSGDCDAIAKLQERTDALRERKNLPSLKVLHNAWPGDLRTASVSGKLRVRDENGQLTDRYIEVPHRLKPWQAKVLIVDYNLRGGCASDAERIAKEEHCQVNTRVAPNLLSIASNSFAMAVAVEHVMRAGGEFYTSFNSAVFADVQSDPVAYVMRRLDDEWETDVGDRTQTSDADARDHILSDDALCTFVETIDDVPAATRFDGVMSFGEWSMCFADTLTMGDDEQECAVHVALVRTEATKHVFLCAWQVSQERNLELLAKEAEDAIADDEYDDVTDDDGSEDE